MIQIILRAKTEHASGEIGQRYVIDGMETYKDLLRVIIKKFNMNCSWNDLAFKVKKFSTGDEWISPKADDDLLGWVIRVGQIGSDDAHLFEIIRHGLDCPWDSIIYFNRREY